MPRIISGSARGTHLQAPQGQHTRPTADRVKEALFSILMPLLPAEGFLDLYAGTGQIGLEAASRGSSPVILVENDRTALAVIRNNLARTHLAAQVRLLTGDVRHIWPQLLAAGPFAIIFLDPPYRLAAAAMIASGPDLARLLRPGGRVVLEHDAAEPAPIVTNLQLVRSCQYGTAMLSFYTGDCDR